LTEGEAKGGAADHRPVAGLFGKLPQQGDFVERGLPPAFRRHWDQWLTRHVAPRQRAGAAFPVGGVRFRLVSGSATAAGVILPSHDSAGRLFPLCLMLIADAAISTEAVDVWCDGAQALPLEALSADDLWQALDDLPPPPPSGEPGPPMLELWASAGQPCGFVADSAEGDMLLQRLMPV